MSIQLQFENVRNVEAYRIAQARAEDARLSAFGDEQLGKQGVGSVIKSGAAESMAVNRDAQIAADEKNKKDAVETQVLLASIKSAEMTSAQLALDIQDLEIGLVKQHGEEWREEIALRVLDPDEIPECGEYESVEDYRDRLEPLLITKMLDKDGNIKQQYLDDPDTAKAARWAQKQYDKQQVDQFIKVQNDPSLSKEDRIESGKKWVDSSSHSRTRGLVQQDAGGAEVDNEVLEMVAERTDQEMNNVSDASSEMNFLNMG